MSKIIRASEAGDCQAWQVPEMQSSGRARSKPMTARQLEEIQVQARAEGFEQGVQEGRDAGLKSVEQRVEMLDQMLAGLEKPFAELDSRVERQVAELAMLVARQLVRRELKTEPEQVIAAVRDALAALPVAAGNVRLALHPEDAVLIRQTLSVQEGEVSMQIVEDPVQSRGGCRIYTDASQIDASVESRLNAVIANVLGSQRSCDKESD
ncbi:Flagellar assembly protein FliH [hydrothermal vent metagenome]|uniref:Flagellar assembly protein FliH n=1 Tax=hydrothermal vent metagenome TaxID=652676 RepID=A0A3B0YXQ9_9ZZZZ